MDHREPLYAFNRGIVSPLAAARVDLKRLALSATEQTNFVPRAMGPMSLRPGMGYLGSVLSASVRSIPFIFAVDDTASIELTPGFMRVWVNDALLVRPTVSTTIANSQFTTDLTSWASKDDVGGVSSWYATPTGSLKLLGDGVNFAAREQTVAVAAGDIGVLHALNVTISGAPAIVTIGSATGGVDYLDEVTLYPGEHSITFTPAAASFYLRVKCRSSYPSLVDSMKIHTGGVLSLAAPWTTAKQLNDIRFDQSADVIFLACNGVRQQRIERRANGSWSLVDYVVTAGPFRATNVGTTTLTAAALIGETTLTASKALFKSTHVGALFRMVSRGQNVAANISAQAVYTDPIRVSGVGADRAFTRVVSGTWAGTLTLQRSLGIVGLWTDVTTVTNGTVSFNDTFDNQIIYYRIGFNTGGYTSGTAAVSLAYASGSITGVGRITAYTSPTVVTVSVLTAFGSVTASSEWAEGAWSDYRGYPSAVGFHEGRLWWAGLNKQWGSVSDDYANFDDETIGDSGPISRSIGTGPLDKVRWLVATNRLILGGQGAEWTARSSNLDEPLTPTNFGLKAYTNRGSGSVSGLAVDKGILFIDKSESRMFELVYDQGEYVAVDVTAIAPEVCQPSVVRLVAQRLPDTRVHAVLSDGTVALLVYDKIEDVKAWVKIVTDGLIVDAVVLPSPTGEDSVYYVVQRIVGGVPVNFFEKLASATVAIGAMVNKMADAFVHYSGAATTVISGLGHLEGRTVVCWADGVDRGTFVVSGGAITLPVDVATATVGLTYRGRFQSTELGYATQGGATLSAYGKNKITGVALLLLNTHPQGLRYGTEFALLDDMPLYEDSALVDLNTVWPSYSGNTIEVNGTLDNNTKLCLEANAPRPCTVLAVIPSVV